MVLDEVSALTNAGSLISPAGEIVASYDLEVTDTPALDYRDLAQVTGICNAARRPFSPDYAKQSRVHVINGMGVTLGDSIIGLTALSAIRSRHPSLEFVIYRPAHSPRYVKQLYELAAPLFGTIVDLPVRLDAIPERELKVDIGNHLFWPNFSTWPMIDFFLDAMGVCPADIPPDQKRNQWLRQLALPLPELPCELLPESRLSRRLSCHVSCRQSCHLNGGAPTMYCCAPTPARRYAAFRLRSGPP